MPTQSRLFLIQCALRKEMYLRKKKEVEEYSCLSIIQRETSFHRGLEIGHEIGTTL